MATAKVPRTMNYPADVDQMLQEIMAKSGETATAVVMRLIREEFEKRQNNDAPESVLRPL